jgi:hypothetical protein
MAAKIGAVGYLECSAFTGQGVGPFMELAAFVAASSGPSPRWKKKKSCVVV